MKRIMVVALYRGISEYYCEYLQNIFGDLLQIESYYIENNPEDFDFDGDLIVTSSDILFEHVKRLNKNHVEVIVMRRTFTKEGFDKLKEIDEEKEIFFVSNFHQIAVECVSKLYELGIKNLKLIPYNSYSPYNETVSGIKTAVIAGKTENIPDFIEEIIDVGDRVIDLSTIADIGAALKLSGGRFYDVLEQYQKKLAYTDCGIGQILIDSGSIKKQIQTILRFTNDSVIATDLRGYITEYNEAGERNFGLKREVVIGRKIDEVFPQLGVENFLKDREEADNELVSIGHINYVISRHGIYNDEEQLIGVIILGQKYMERENEQNKLRSKLLPRGHVAKYNMESILGDSLPVKEAKKVAEKMAKSSSTVLITGESGTGKEIFAQAIHNQSPRRNGPFIAVNCSALAPSLLESELFGYEEGAFTGAKKGGKIGLFEMANQGTIFLDEIGELPYELQAKLLRVLMEREVMRIGGVDLISIDVRVIAATNKDLLKRIAEGQFREDLYYRLNVLPLSLPPLRQRRSDIPVLASAFLKEFGGEKALSPEILQVLIRYPWPGNIRELHNCIEYMYQLSEEEILLTDIPENIRNYEGTPVQIQNDILKEEELAVLSATSAINDRKQSAGRKTIQKLLSERKIQIAEQEIRLILKKLAELSLVEVHKGRGGTQITDKGNRVLADGGILKDSKI